MSNYQSNSFQEGNHQYQYENGLHHNYNYGSFEQNQPISVPALVKPQHSHSIDTSSPGPRRYIASDYLKGISTGSRDSLPSDSHHSRTQSQEVGSKPLHSQQPLPPIKPIRRMDVTFSTSSHNLHSDSESTLQPPILTHKENSNNGVRPKKANAFIHSSIHQELNETKKNKEYSKDSNDGLSKINTSPKYQDIWASILFTLNYLSYAYCLYIGTAKLKRDREDKLEAQHTESSSASHKHSSNSIYTLTTNEVTILAVSTAVSGFVLSTIYIMLIRRFTSKMIYFSILTQLCLLTILTVACFLVGSIITGIISAIITVFFAYYFWRCRRRIPLAKILFQTVIDVMKQFPGTTITGYMGMVMQVIVSFFWVSGISGMFSYISTESNENTKAYIFASVFMTFSFYWIAQVVKNIVHVTVSGTFAIFYFAGMPAGGTQISVPVKNPTLSSAKRALTTSYGSICFGSLIISIIQLFKTLTLSATKMVADNGSSIGVFCGMCVCCCCQSIQNVLEYFNHYAFTQVAIYGKSFCEAANSTWKLIKTRGIDAIINDSIISPVLFVAGFILGQLGILCGCLLVYLIPSIPKEPIHYALAGVMSFIIFKIEFGVLAEVMKSGIATTFVCLAEDPRALKRTKPELFEKIRKIYPDVDLGL